jgi:nucleoside-diphosphate-sugar epimerase
MEKTIMVTGGSGFLGSYVCKILSEHGYKVVSYDMRPPRGESLFIQKSCQSEIKYENGQVTDLSRVLTVCKAMKVNKIVHIASYVDVGGSVEQPSLTYKVNTEGSIVIYEAARFLDIDRIVLISSNAVYQKKKYEPINEKHPVFSPFNGNLAAHYGASKIAAEIIGLTYSTFNGLDLIILRMSSIYGFGMQIPLYVKPMVENAVLNMSSNFPTGGSMLRDYTYVKDSAKAVYNAIEVDNNHLNQKVFNISGGKLYSAIEVAKIVKDEIHAADIQINEKLSPIEESDIKARGVLDCSKAKEILGYFPKYDLKHGVQEYISLFCTYLEDRKGGDGKN